MTALFLMATAIGHLNATFRLARKLQAEGYRVVYGFGGDADMARRIVEQGFGVHWLQSQPFGIGVDEAQNKDRSESYLETLLDRISGRDLSQRTTDLQRALTTLQPTLILLDPFLSTDFIVLYPLLTTHPARVVLAETMLPNYDDGYAPPLNTLLTPGQHNPQAIRRAWQRHYQIRYWLRLCQTIKYFGYSPRQQIYRAFRQNGLPDTYRLRDDKLFHIGFDGLPVWIMAPPTFDFADRPLLPYQQYLGLTPDLDRSEALPPAYQSLLERLTREREQNPDTKLIYISLGTVAQAHTKPHCLLRFFGQLMTATATQPNWRLIVSVDKDLKEKLTCLHHNAFVFEWVPQLHILRHADLFVTHGGLNSVLEGAALNIPMLVFPLNQRWDQPGNAARVVAHGIGRLGNLREVDSHSLIDSVSRLLAKPNERSKMQKQTGQTPLN